MYDKLFSEQWWFDRCVEGVTFEFLIAGILTLLIAIALFFLLKKLKFSNLKATLLLFLSCLIIAPSTLFFIQIIGYFVIGCGDYSFWKGIMAANELYTKVKYECKKNNCPKSEKELAQLDSNLFRAINFNAKSKYTYNPKTKKFTWYVRPSYYYMASFEGNGFAVIQLPNIIKVRHLHSSIFKGRISEIPK